MEMQEDLELTSSHEYTKSTAIYGAKKKTLKTGRATPTKWTDKKKTTIKLLLKRV